MKDTSWFARVYIERYGFHLVRIGQNSKIPVLKDWGNNCIYDPDEAENEFSRDPFQNIGFSLHQSKMCSLDIDCLDSFQKIIGEFGIPLSELDGFPCIQGAKKGKRIVFRLPVGSKIEYSKLNWPKEEDSTKNYTVFELRVGSETKSRFDMLPPSIHPDTREPYQWIVKPPKTLDEWPEPPGWLMAIWEAWGSFKPQLIECCPWYESPVQAYTENKPKRNLVGQAGVIDACIERESLSETLLRFGYKKIGRRWLSPHSTTGLPGVTVLPDGQRCFIHHASDPLCSEESGKPVNAFDLICHYEYGGDAGKAVKALADEYGLRPGRTIENPPAAVSGTVEPAQDPARPVATQAPSATPARLTGGGNHNEPLIFTTDKGKPKKHIANLREICRRLGVVIRYNEISKEEEILIPGMGFSRDNEANASLAWLKSECSLYDYPAEAVQDFVTVLADENQYNPVRTWVDSRPWDGHDRIAELLDTVKARLEDRDPNVKWLKEQLIKRWMISAIAGAYNPNGVSAHGILVFQGAQYLGKTKWFKSLVPSELDLIKDGMLLRPDDKDSIKQVTSFWLVELGELDSTFRRADIAALKAFITKDSDEYRRPYARRESHYVRRTVFFGSVNPREFLHDNTGNRRYWTIECESLDHSHGIDMQQCWAQVLHLYRQGETHFLTPDEMDALNEHNASFMAAEPVDEKISGGFDWDAPQATWRWMTATDVLREVGIDRPTRGETTSAAITIRAMNGGLGRRSRGRNLLMVPPTKSGLP